MRREMKPTVMPFALVALLPLLSALAGSADVPGIAHPLLWPAGPHELLIRPDTERFVDQLLGQMSLEEKVGQMIQADIDSITPEDERHYRLGSILAGGNAAPGHNVRSSAQAWRDLVRSFDRAALDADGLHHAPIPILFGIDAVHGDAKVLGATIFPHNVGLGAAHDPDLIQRIGHATAEEVASTGIDWTFAPTVAVVRDPRWGRSYESYSEDPQLVASYAASMVEGLQGKFGAPDFMTPGHTLASAKHFLGDGGTQDGRDQGNNLATEQQLIAVHAPGYEAAIRAGAMIVMASYNSWQGVKMHANESLLTQVLKGRMGFDGFVVGDWNAQEEIPGCTKYSCAQAILAGVDMIMAPDSWKRLYDNTVSEVRTGVIPQARIDDAVRRILRVKALAGLFERAKSFDSTPVAPPSQVLGSPAHRALAREAVRKSLVLLKNEQQLLPLNPHMHVLVAGSGADSIGMQTGGWTLDWQGDHNQNQDFPGATSILAGIQAAVSAAGGQVQFSPDAHFRNRPDVAIVVYGESPYSEFEGDRETLQFSAIDPHPLALLQRLQQQSIPVVSVFLSGRVMWTNPELAASNAFVAAWLPGSEGEGIADLLFSTAGGARSYDFSGTLPFSWPSTAMPARIDADGQVTGALFARGSGLHYASASAPTAPMSMDPQVPAGRNDASTLFAQSHVTAPWSIYLSDDIAQVRLTTAQQLSPSDSLEIQLNEGTLAARWAGKQDATLWIGGRAQDLSAPEWGRRALQLRLRVDTAPLAAVRLGMLCEAAYQRGPLNAALPTLAREPTAAAPAPAVSAQPAALCGNGPVASFDVTRSMNQVPVGQWQTLTLPLSCLNRRGAHLRRVSAPLAISTRGSFALSMSDARFVTSPVGASCPDESAK